MKILDLTYKFTNCYLIESISGWIMVDAGWPDTFTQVMHLMRQKDVNTSDIKYLMITHFHPDHAGLAQDFKDLGVNLVLHEVQAPFVDKLNIFFKRNPKSNFKDITDQNNTILKSAESRAFFKSNGIDGEMIETPGHSEDSISLVIDGCCAFTGDLPMFSMAEAYNDQRFIDSWDLIRRYDVKTIYPAHGNSYIL